MASSVAGDGNPLTDDLAEQGVNGARVRLTLAVDEVLRAALREARELREMQRRLVRP